VLNSLLHICSSSLQLSSSLLLLSSASLPWLSSSSLKTSHAGAWFPYFRAWVRWAKRRLLYSHTSSAVRKCPLLLCRCPGGARICCCTPVELALRCCCCCCCCCRCCCCCLVLSINGPYLIQDRLQDCLICCALCFPTSWLMCSKCSLMREAPATKTACSTCTPTCVGASCLSAQWLWHEKNKKKEKNLYRQWNHSLHRLRKRRHIGPKSRESPPPGRMKK